MRAPHLPFYAISLYFSHQNIELSISPVEETLPPVAVAVWEDEARQSLKTPACVVLSPVEKQNVSLVSMVVRGGWREVSKVLNIIR